MDVWMGVHSQAPRALTLWDAARDEESRGGGQRILNSNQWLLGLLWAHSSGRG